MFNSRMLITKKIAVIANEQSCLLMKKLLSGAIIKRATKLNRQQHFQNSHFSSASSSSTSSHTNPIQQHQQHIAETKSEQQQFVDLHNRDQWPAGMVDQFLTDCTIRAEFVSQEEEAQLLAEIEPHMKRMRWEEEHWDQQIHLYREREQRSWTPENQRLIDRIWEASFEDQRRRSPFVHVLDLHADGFIRPYLDEKRYCGPVISGLSLLSACVMRLRHNDEKMAESCWADILLPRRSLYRLKGVARFEFTHAILASAESRFRDQPVTRQRRISVICREFPEQQPTIVAATESVMRTIPPAPVE